MERFADNLNIHNNSFINNIGNSGSAIRISNLICKYKCVIENNKITNNKALS